jgi:rhodanese-like protein
MVRDQLSFEHRLLIISSFMPKCRDRKCRFLRTLEGTPVSMSGPSSLSEDPRSPLVSTKWVQEHLQDNETRIVEVSYNTTAYYGEGHIPGAVLWHWRDDLHLGVQDRLLTTKELEAVLDKSGVSLKTRVVLYGDIENLLAIQTFLELRILGLSNSSVMDGGRDRWVDERRPLGRQTPSFPRTGIWLPLRPQNALSPFKKEVLDFRTQLSHSLLAQEGLSSREVARRARDTQLSAYLKSGYARLLNLRTSAGEWLLSRSEVLADTWTTGYAPPMSSPVRGIPKDDPSTVPIKSAPGRGPKLFTVMGEVHVPNPMMAQAVSEVEVFLKGEIGEDEIKRFSDEVRERLRLTVSKQKSVDVVPRGENFEIKPLTASLAVPGEKTSSSTVFQVTPRFMSDTNSKLLVYFYQDGKMLRKANADIVVSTKPLKAQPIRTIVRVDDLITIL